jgi:hypothetical protein
MRFTRKNTTTETKNTATVLATTIMNNTYPICGKRIGSVPVDLMEIDYSYQRVLGTTIKKLMNEWDNEKCNFLLVSFRDNKFYIIDGQHRYSVAKAKGIYDLPCIILTGLTQSQEALKFAQQQDNVNKLNPYDVFKANIACGDASIPAIRVDMEIKRICDNYNVHIKKYGNYKGEEKIFRSLSTARAIVKTENGVQNFEKFMAIVNITNWKETSTSYSDKFVTALNSFLIDNKDNMETIEPKLIKVMNKYSPEDLAAYSNYRYPEYPWRAAIALGLRDAVAEEN